MSLFFECWINRGLIFLTDLKITNSELDEVYIYEKLQHKANYLCEILVMKKAIKTILKQKPNNIPRPELITKQIYHVIILQKIFRLWAQKRTISLLPKPGNFSSQT